MRGRPKSVEKEPSTTVFHTDNPSKFNKMYKNDDGTVDVWSYNLEISKTGPISVETFYPKNHVYHPVDDNATAFSPTSGKKIPLSKRTFIHPINGKEIGYTRMYNLVKEGIAQWPEDL